MSHPSFIPTRDPRVRAVLETELARAAKTRGLRPLLRHEPDLWPRFAGYYQHLCHLPRRVRRSLQRQWRRSLSAIALLLALGQAPALAATLPVAPGIPPDINNDGLCALIEAIENANADAATHDDCLAGSGADTIRLPAGSTQSLTAVHPNTTYGETGLPDITSTITIEGKGSTIAREASAPEFRILAVGTAGDLTLNQTTVSGGAAIFCCGYGARGGGVANYGGTLTLTHSTVSGNSAAIRGGGVANEYGVLTVTNSTVSGNTAFIVGSGIGGGVFNDGTLTLTHSTVSGNSAGDEGGGLHNRGTLTLTNSTVSGNSAIFSGGGVRNPRYSGSSLTNSTVSGNTAGAGGGLDNGGTLTLTNSTVSGNSAIFSGGGVKNGTYYGYGTLTLTRTLVSGNTGSTGPEILHSGRTVAANNHNLFGHDGDAGVSGFTPGLTDIVPSEALSTILAPLADNGGPTQTHALVAGSPAVDTSPVDSECQPVDQRGVSRPKGAACDIGAFEQGPPLRCQGKIVRILGTIGHDNLIGTPGPDVLHGLGGRDVIHGLAGNDSLCGGTHRDNLFGGRGADRLDGGGQTDNCNGGAGTADAAVNCETMSGVP
ncbi:MAG: choice-of-anchor Q domain-containing protein [Chromatiales bacterium]